METSLLDLHLNELEEPAPVPGGEQYELKVLKAELMRNKNDTRNMIRLIAEIQDQPSAPSVFDYMNLPTKEDTAKAVYMFKKKIKDFCDAVGLDSSDPGTPVEVAGSDHLTYVEWKGLSGFAILEHDTFEGRESNKIVTWIIPK